MYQMKQRMFPPSASLSSLMAVLALALVLLLEPAVAGG